MQKTIVLCVLSTYTRARKKWNMHTKMEWNGIGREGRVRRGVSEERVNLNNNDNNSNDDDDDDDEGIISVCNEK